METAPGSILIVGSGLFGLGTAWALTKRPFFRNTTITIVDDARGQFPPDDCASVDASRIVRADYADTDYATLAAEAQTEWRKQGDRELGGQGRYSENGLVITANQCATSQSGHKTGLDYVKASWENVTRIASETGLAQEKIVKLESREAIQAYLGAEGNVGDWGYSNTLSGWADNGASMRWLYEQVRKTGRVEFVDARVEALATRGKRVVGARLVGGGTTLEGDVVFVAAGAWTGALVDLRGRCEATGQAVAYVAITDEEQRRMEHQPTILNLSTGLFILPPRDGLLKVARHGFGYLNPQTVAHALPLSPEHRREPIVVSVPRTSRDNGFDGLPAEGDQALREALRDLSPVEGMDRRPWAKTRLCWYSDTRDADWLVDWHPGWEGLFVATGDSGHGFKFLPNIGERLVDCLQGQGGKLGYKWKWKHIDDDGLGRETAGVYRGLNTWDGSRGGLPDMILDEELRKLAGGRGKSQL